MPNWCDCSLTAETDTHNASPMNTNKDFMEEVERCIKETDTLGTKASVSGPWDFDILTFFYPPPEELSRNYSPNWGQKPEGESEALVREKERRIAMYGVSNGYDWCVKNWGTKWDATELYINFNQSFLTFQTAWAPPEMWLVHVSQRFPDTTFTLAYCEIGTGFAGYTKVKNGTVEEVFDFEGEWSVEKIEGHNISYEMSKELRDFLKEHRLRGTGG